MVKTRPIYYKELSFYDPYLLLNGLGKWTV
jgi:hypothetical protein